MPGLNAAFDRAGPFISAMAEGLSETGSALGTFIDDVSESEGAVDGLEAAFNIINGTIILTGKLVNALSDEFHRWLERMSFLTGIIEDIPGLPPAVTRGWALLNNALEDNLIHAEDADEAMQSFGDAADGASFATDRLKEALSGAHDEFLMFESAEIDAQAALDDLQSALEESNGSINVHTEKGRNARDMLIKFARASAEAANAKLNETRSTKEAGRIYDEYRKDLINTLIAAGKTRREAERLADAWLAVPAKVETEVITRRREFVYPTRVLQDKGRAAGGRVSRGETYRVEEQRPEYFTTFTAPADGFVMPIGAAPPSSAAGRSGTTVEKIVVQAWSDRFSLPQIERELAMHGAH
jgi:hypothetical protein